MGRLECNYIKPPVQSTRVPRARGRQGHVMKTQIGWATDTRGESGAMRPYQVCSKRSSSTSGKHRLSGVSPL